MFAETDDCKLTAKTGGYIIVMTDDNKKDKSKLSKRELQVLEAVAKGMSNQEIGRELVISENTVRVHLRKIYAKLEVQSRTEATMKGLQIGIIEMPPGDDDDTESARPAASNGDTVALVAAPRLAGWQLGYFALAIVAATLVLLTPYWRRTFNHPAGNPILDAPAPLSGAEAAIAPPENQWQLRGQMPTARSRMGVTNFNGKLYLIGGERTSGTTGLVEIFDPAIQKWLEGAAKPTAVANVQALALGDEIFVPGGCTTETEAVSAVEVFNPAENTWRTAAPLPSPRCAYAATVYRNKLYLFGGWNGTAYLTETLVYTPADDTWQKLDAPLPTAVGFAAAASLGDEIYVAGGYDGEREYDTVNRFNPQTKAWTPAPALNHPRGGLGLVTLGDTLYAVGGGWTAMVANSEKLSRGEQHWVDITSPRVGEWRNLGLAAVDRDIFAVGGWDGEYLSEVYSYKTVYKIFIPLSY